MAARGRRSSAGPPRRQRQRPAGVEPPSTSTQRPSPELPPPPPPLPTAVADTHTHLDLQDVQTDDAVTTAAEVGVAPLVQVGVDVMSSRWGAELAAALPGVWATAALHPNEAPRLVLGDVDSWRPGPPRPPGGMAALDLALAEIDKLALLPQVRGIGETGLDHFRTGEEGLPAQEYSFRRHLEMAKAHEKPLIIHDRDAHDEVLRILAADGAPAVVVFHCFSGDAAMAKVCAEHGYYMSFAGNVTFSSASPLRDALLATPVDLLLVETDAPFLTPVPYRGRPNASYLVPWTVRKMAEVKGIPEETMAVALGANAERVFGPFA
jgi:TatD DNase family protein